MSLKLKEIQPGSAININLIESVTKVESGGSFLRLSMNSGKEIFFFYTVTADRDAAYEDIVRNPANTA